MVTASVKGHQGQEPETRSPDKSELWPSRAPEISLQRMGSRTLLLMACVVGCVAATLAQSPTAVAYLNRFNLADVDRLTDASSGYTHLLFSFWTASYGPVDAVLTWSLNNLANDPRIQAARSRGVKFMISCGGATEEPQRSVNGADYGRRAAQYAMDNGFDGVDFDIEGNDLRVGCSTAYAGRGSRLQAPPLCKGGRCEKHRSGCGLKDPWTPAASFHCLSAGGVFPASTLEGRPGPLTSAGILVGRPVLPYYCTCMFADHSTD